MKNPNDSFNGVEQSFRLYWKIYGGLKDLVRSPYLYMAGIISIVAYPAWMQSDQSSGWWDSALSVIPSVLGFALGGYTMMLAFGGERFGKALAGSDGESDKPSPFMLLNGAFVHFIVFNVLAILVALVAKAWKVSSPSLNCIGFFLFVYGLLTAVATTFTILFMAEMFDLSASRKTSPQA